MMEVEFPPSPARKAPQSASKAQSTPYTTYTAMHLRVHRARVRHSLPPALSYMRYPRLLAVRDGFPRRDRDGQGS